MSGDWSSIQVLSGNEVVGSVAHTSSALDASGSDTVSVPVTLTQFGSNALSIKVTNFAGLSTTDEDVGTVIYDPAPAAPTVGLLDDTSGGKGVTSDDTLVGTAMPNSTVSDGYGTATVGADGTFTLKSSIPDGAHTLEVTDTNVYGTVSAATPISFTLDTKAPPAPTAYFLNNGVQSDLSSTPLVTVSAEAGTAITVSDNGEVLATGAASSAGLFTFDLPTLGSYTLSLTSTDVAGNTTTATSATLLYDPTVPVVTLTLADDTGGGDVTSDGLVQGTADPNTTVTINEGAGVAPFTATTDANGDFSFTLAPDATEYSVIVSDTSDTGVVGASSPLDVLVQPASLSQPTLQLVRVSGVGGATNDPDILVGADANTTITISDDGTVIGTVAGTGGLTPFDPTLADGALRPHRRRDQPCGRGQRDVRAARFHLGDRRQRFPARRHGRQRRQRRAGGAPGCVHGDGSDQFDGDLHGRILRWTGRRGLRRRRGRRDVRDGLRGPIAQGRHDPGSA